MCICLCICLGVCGRVQIIYGGPWGSVLRLIEPKTACAYVSTPHIIKYFDLIYRLVFIIGKYEKA